MMPTLSLFFLLAGTAALIGLAAVDMKTRFLPNQYVLLFAAFGVAFHISTFAAHMSLADALAGCLAGGGFLYAIRWVSHRFYMPDSLGMGDVKLMAAAGLWLGPHNIMLALIVGAGFGLIYGLCLALSEKIKTGALPEPSTLSMPAGPGFAAGILFTGILAFKDYPVTTWP